MILPKRYMSLGPLQWQTFDHRFSREESKALSCSVCQFLWGKSSHCGSHHSGHNQQSALGDLEKLDFEPEQGGTSGHEPASAHHWSVCYGFIPTTARVRSVASETIDVFIRDSCYSLGVRQINNHFRFTQSPFNPQTLIYKLF